MLTEEGIVKELRGRTARVSTHRSSTCGSCGVRNACHALGGADDAEITAINQADAKVGDVVELALPEGALLKASVAVYLVPVTTLLIGAVLGHTWHDGLGLGADGAAALGALAGILVGLGFTWLASRHAARTGSTLPVIQRVVGRKEAQAALGAQVRQESSPPES